MRLGFGVFGFRLIVLRVSRFGVCVFDVSGFVGLRVSGLSV